VWNLVSHIKGREHIEGVGEEGIEGNKWNCEGGSNRTMDKTAL
jgi:hypothetical protein